QFSLPSLSDEQTVAIRGTPDDKTLWDALGYFELGPQGSVVPKATPHEFFLVQGTFRSGLDTITLVYFFLSPFRDATEEAFAKLEDPPSVEGPEARQKDRSWVSRINKNWPPTSWSTPTLSEFYAVTPDVLDEDDVSFDLVRGQGSSVTTRILE